MASRLTSEQVQHFRDQGYLLYHEPVFAPDVFAGLKSHFETMLADWEQRTGMSPEHMDCTHFFDTEVHRWLFDDRVLDIVESVIGPDIALWASHFLCKPPGRGKRVPWHEDSTYWGKDLQPMDVVTIWLAIDQSTPENGCMRVVPGTHHNGYSAYDPVKDAATNVFGSEIRADQVAVDQAVDCILEPNECSIHHAKLIHGSNPNTSDKRRCGFTMRYVSTRCRYQPSALRKERGFSLYLARGRDHAGNSYLTPGQRNEVWKSNYSLKSDH